jgi:hypothetical protein
MTEHEKAIRTGTALETDAFTEEFEARRYGELVG